MKKFPKYRRLAPIPAFSKRLGTRICPNHNDQACNQLGTPGEAKSFCDWPKFVKLRPILSNYGQHIFPGGKFF